MEAISRRWSVIVDHWPERQKQRSPEIRSLVAILAKD
jgi:hypothetical protein